MSAVSVGTLEPISARPASGFRVLPIAAQLYIAAVVAGGAATFVAFVPTTFPQPWLFATLLVTACLTSAWKVTLPLSVGNGSTLSVSYAANLMMLLLLGPQYAVVSAVAGVWTQCAYKVRERYPLHRTLFSMATATLTMACSGVVYNALGGHLAPVDAMPLARPLAGAIGTYFLVNTLLVAGAIALSARRSFLATWHEDFLWSGASFMVAGSAGALAAIVIARGDEWKAVFLVAPLYLTYRTYELFVGRLDDERRHTEQSLAMQQETMRALNQAREAEHALAAEKERLGRALAEMTELQQWRDRLLAREQAGRAVAEEASRIKDQFLAVVSHELRTPLNAILGWSDMLRRDMLSAPVRERAHQTIYDSARRQAQLIEDLLDVSRITSGKLRLERTSVDLAEPLHDALQVVEPGADAKGVHVHVDVDPAVGTVFGDASRLQQIIWNLLSNAVKFTPEGGAVYVRMRRTASSVELTVSDTGQGIAPEFLPRVFDAFRQEDASTTRVQAGLGLGLSIVKSLVEAHGGTIRVDSEGRGRGASFTVRLPIAAVSAEITKLLSPATAPSAALNPSSLRGLTVLVVDDDEGSRDVLAAHLQNCRAEVLTASSAAKGFDVLMQRHVDVLLADIGMPGEDGYSFIRRVRASNGQLAGIPAAALTAFAREEDQRQALDAGFQMHLTKPLDSLRLVTAVADLSRSRLPNLQTQPAQAFRG